jgi:hypothetical protein
MSIAANAPSIPFKLRRSGMFARRFLASFNARNSLMILPSMILPYLVVAHHNCSKGLRGVFIIYVQNTPASRQKARKQQVEPNIEHLQR